MAFCNAAFETAGGPNGLEFYKPSHATPPSLSHCHSVSSTLSHTLSFSLQLALSLSLSLASTLSESLSLSSRWAKWARILRAC